MEENEKKEEEKKVITSEEPVVEKKEEKTEEPKVEKSEESTSSENKNNKVVDFIKAKKMVILAVIAIIIVIAIIWNLISVSPADAVKGYVSALNNGNSKKAFTYVDLAGYYTIISSDEDEYDDYEDFWDDYQDVLDDDDAADYIEEFEDYLDDSYEDLDDEIEDSESTVKIKKIKSTEKISKNFYKVKAQIQTIDEDDDESLETETFYVVKKGTKSYIVYFSGLSSLTGYYSSSYYDDLLDELYNY